MEKNTVRESFALREKVAVPCAATPSVVLIVALMVTLPPGVTVPVPFTEMVATGVNRKARETLATVMAVVV